MSTIPATTIPTADLRSLQQLLQADEPVYVTQVMSAQGVVVYADEAHIEPFETPRGDLAFLCIYPDGDRLTICNVDSFLWHPKNEQ